MSERVADVHPMCVDGHSVANFPTDPAVWTVECVFCGEIVMTRDDKSNVACWRVMPEKVVVVGDRSLHSVRELRN